VPASAGGGERGPRLVRTLAIREQVLAEYVEHYRGLRERARAQEPGLPEVPDEFLRALVGGIAELVQKAVILTALRALRG